MLVAATGDNRRLLHVLTMTRLAGVDFRGWAIFTDEETHTSDGETTAGWAPSPVHPEALQFLMPLGLFPRDSRACIFSDSQYAADVCLGSVQPRCNVRLAGFGQQLLLQMQLRISGTLSLL